MVGVGVLLLSLGCQRFSAFSSLGQRGDPDRPKLASQRTQATIYSQRHPYAAPDWHAIGTWLPTCPSI
jgi:hypothetical protein